MPNALIPLRLLQIGFESTAGTAVAATKKVIGKAGIKPIIEWDKEDYPRGVRGQVDEILAVMRAAEITVEADLSYEQLQWALHSGLQTVSPTGAGPYTWEHLLGVTAPTLKTMTVEAVVDDGSTKHYQREFAYGFTKELNLLLPANGVGKLGWTMGARAEQTSTVTGSLSAISFARVPANHFKLWIDDTWNNLGTTQKTATFREANLKIPTGVFQDFTLDGRDDLDSTHLAYKKEPMTLELKMRHNASTATEIGNWRTGTKRFIRIKEDNGAASGANRAITVDVCARFLDWDMDEEDGQEVVNAQWEIVYDTTSAKFGRIEVINGLSALQ